MSERYPLDFFDIDDDKPDILGMTNEDWRRIKTTDDLPVWDPSENLIDYLIGQDHIKSIILMIAENAAQGFRRHLFITGSPGTGKSLAAKALAQEIGKRRADKVFSSFNKDEYLGKNRKSLEDILLEFNLVDVVSFKNEFFEDNPLIRCLPPGTGRPYIEKILRAQKRKDSFKHRLALGGLITWETLAVAGVGAIFYNTMKNSSLGIVDFFKYGSQLQYMMLFGLVAFTPILIYIFGRMIMGQMLGGQTSENKTPQLLVDRSDGKVPFIDASGAGIQGLLGSVKHDPYQTGGLGTPAHARITPGLVHLADGGVLFIDEIDSVFNDFELLKNFLTIMEEEKCKIQYHGHSGSGGSAHNVVSEDLPARFMLVAGGNLDSQQRLHPALRSRIIGYGYELKVNETMENTALNRRAVARFVEQTRRLFKYERNQDLLPFSREAMIEIVYESLEMGGGKKLTTHFRDLGGVVMAASDIANTKGEKIVLPEHVLEARKKHVSLEEQSIIKNLEYLLDHSPYCNNGGLVGRVNGLSVLRLPSGKQLGKVLPIEASVVPGSGNVHATGKLQIIAQEAITNSSAIIKKLFGKTLEDYDVHLQYIQTYDGVEGDSASVDNVIAVISDICKIPVDQSVGMTGALTVKGYVLPVGGVHAKLRAAELYDLETVIIPEKNRNDIDPQNYSINILYAKTIADYCRYALIGLSENLEQKLVELENELKRI